MDNANIALGAQQRYQILTLPTEWSPAPAPSRGELYLSAIEGWHTELFALAKVAQDSYVAPTDEELNEMLYDE